jgi:hypothetical protein
VEPPRSAKFNSRRDNPPLGLGGGSSNYYAYADNDPISRTDPFGLQTGGLGVQANLQFLSFGASASLSFVVDAQGQVGLAATLGTGGAGGSSLVSGSVVAQVQGTNAATIQQLEGPGATATVSIQAPVGPVGVVGQAEYFVGQGYSGATGGIGLGVPRGPGFTESGEATKTWVRCLVNCGPAQPSGLASAGLSASLAGRKR